MEAAAITEYPVIPISATLHENIDKVFETILNMNSKLTGKVLYTL